MAKRLSGSTLMGSSSLLQSDDYNPMESVSNIMDVMLVFACGLLLALIMHWNVDINEESNPNVYGEKIEGQAQEIAGGISLEGDEYSELGTVYRNEETGELYIVDKG